MKFLKNYQLNPRSVQDRTVSISNDSIIFDNEHGILFPRGDTDKRISEKGYARYNNETNVFEFFQNNTWVQLGSASGQIANSENYQLYASKYTTSNTNTVVLDSFTITQYRSAKYSVQITYNNTYQVFELNALQNDSEVYTTQYLDNNINTNGLGTMDLMMIGNNVNLVFTPNVAGTSINVLKHYTPVSYNSNSQDVWVDANGLPIVNVSNPNFNTKTGYAIVGTLQPAIIDSFDAATYRSGKYKIQISKLFNHQTIEFSILHDDTQVLMTSYLDNTLGDLSGTIDAMLNGNNIDIIFTPFVTQAQIVYSRGLFTSATNNDFTWTDSGNRSAIKSGHFTLATTDSTVIASFNRLMYRSAQYQVQLSSGTQFNSIDLSLAHNDFEVYLTSYLRNTVGNELGTFDATIVGNNVEITFTPYSIDSIDGIYVETVLGV